MTKFKVQSEKAQRLLELMAKLGVYEEDLLEKFVRGSGPGGQKINKTSSCVYLLHSPSGIEIKCQKTRSQALNRYYARQELCSRIEQQILGAKSEKKQAQEKIRRQKRKRSKRAKEKMLGEKRTRSATKKLRQRPSDE